MDPCVSLSLIVRHWLPIITFCPVNRLPDVIYISVGIDKFAELYGLRRTIRKTASWRLAFMEDIAAEVLKAIPEASWVELRLAFSRHVVRVTRKEPIQ